MACEIIKEVIWVEDFTINEMQDMQRKLQDKYKEKWESIGPETGKNKLLWMIGEIGEVIDIVKKNGGTKACSDAKLRNGLMQDAMREYTDGVDITYEINLAKDYAGYMVEQITNVRKKDRSIL